MSARSGTRCLLLGALCGACGSSSGPDRSLYEGPNFYESEAARAQSAPTLEPTSDAIVDFSAALLQDGTSAPACLTGPRAVDDDPARQALGLECPPVTRPGITSFSLLPEGSPSGVTFGADAAFPGGTFFYPDASTALRSDVSGDDWHLSGTVNTVSGFGLFLSGCRSIDASAYGGVAFRLWGQIEAPGSLVFFVGSAAHQVSSNWLNANKAAPGDADEPTNLGRCIPLVRRYDNTCREPRIALPVSETPTALQVSWRDLGDGCPEPSVNPVEITAIAWYFPPASRAYEIDLHIDDLRFADLDLR